MAELQWTMILVPTALCLSLVVVAQVVVTYSSAYLAAPHEVAVLIDAVDFSIQENESYDRDVAKVQRLEDKIRLGRLLREIQRGGDDLREHLGRLLLDEGATTVNPISRLLWASHRLELREKLRTLDLLRMRFLVVYMGIIASATTTAAASTSRSPPPPPSPPEEKMTALPSPVTPTLPKSLAETICRRPPLRRLTTQAIGHQETVARPHRKGWAGVVEELQTSPRMQRRHASIEQAMMTRPP
ncbi:hypothetical protein CP532_4280, partial [Ophiocordyceps camponoti-leonardi (nom. inval.)]